MAVHPDRKYELAEAQKKTYMKQQSMLSISVNGIFIIYKYINCWHGEIFINNYTCFFPEKQTQ